MKLAVTDVDNGTLFLTITLKDTVEAADRESKICAIQLTVKLEDCNPAGRRLDPNAMGALERSVACVPLDVM